MIKIVLKINDLKAKNLWNKILWIVFLWKFRKNVIFSAKYLIEICENVYYHIILTSAACI